MAGKFLPLDDHDDDEEDSLLDASVRVERFERKVMGRAWAACAILSLTFAGVALYRHMSAAPPAAGSDVVYPTYMPPVGRMLREWRGRGRNQRRGRGGRRGGRRGGGRAAAASAAAAALFPASTPDGGTLHVIPEGGALALECADGTYVERVSFASFGTPRVHANGSYAADPTCHHAGAEAILRKACEGQSHCCLPVGTDHFERKDPCHGTIKTLAVVVHGCRPPADTQTRYRRWCSLQGQWLLCDEDIEFLAALELPEVAPASLVPNVAAMVDTSWRPDLQHFVVHNVHNTTGWPVQLFHGPSNGPKLRTLFADLVGRGALTLTDLGDDYMEDWQRLSSMMLLDVFWKAAIGRKVLIFQPDSIMCAAATEKIDAFTRYEYVGPPMAGPYWQTSDHNSQWGVGCGGFSLRDRAKSILMSNTPACVTPAAGKLEDQQLGAGWKYIEKRCAAAGITVAKPDRHKAARFAIEYDLYMDVLPGDDASMPGGCTAAYHTCAKYDPGQMRKPPALRIPKWNPHPKPDPNVRCERPHYVPLGCHKCWFWNHFTWKHMRTHCPEVLRMRQLRKTYQIGVEFTGWPTRPKPSPTLGAATPDTRWLPVDMKQGRCRGKCASKPPPKLDASKRTKLGVYHK